MQVSEEMISIIKQTHKFTRTSWEAKTGISYIGYGHTIAKGEVFKKLPKKDCELLFVKDIKRIERQLNLLFKIDIPQNHFDVLASVLFDIGYGLFKTSSLLTLYKKGLIEESSLRIMVWSKYKGIHTEALEYRRRIDYKIFTSNDYAI